MRILIADDDLIARKVLRKFLEKFGHEIQAVNDGQAAWAVLQGPDAPPAAILDWMMPHLSGVQVCEKLRATPSRTRPYVILLSARSEKQDVATGLDAGADDYLAKPFNAVELLARLRVAERTLRHQHELHQHIDQLERLAQRYNLLGEMFGQQNTVPAPVAAQNSPECPALVPAPDEIDAIVCRALAELGLGQATVTVQPAETDRPAASFTAWSAVILPAHRTWLDLLLEADSPAGTAIFEKILRRQPVSERDLPAVLAETLTVICAGLRSALRANNCEALTPFLSQVAHAGNPAVKLPVPEGCERHVYELPGLCLGLLIARQAIEPQRKSAGQLRELDVLAAPFRSPSTEDLLLLNEGVILNERFIEKLSTLAQMDGKRLEVSVFNPSRLAHFFYGNRELGI